MRRKVDWKLVAKYVAGECSESERARVQAWIQENPARAERVDRLFQVWEAAEAPTSDWDAEAAWKRLHRSVQQETEIEPAEPTARDAVRARPVRHARDLRRRARSTQRRLLRVAAIVVAVAALTVLLVQGFPPFEAPSADKKVFATQKGQRATIRLIDGTKVRLNVDSRLVLPEGFSTGQRRDVHLEGEAYFDVARDTTRPFVVRTETASVRVLGTAFGVKAYADEEAVQVAVEEGEVALRPSQPAGRDTVARLQPRSLGIVVGQHLQPVRRNTDLSGELAWTKGRLVFEDAPFDEVVRKLERWYNLRVEAHVSTDAVVGLNATFEEEPLDQVLHDVAVALNLRYRREQNVITFYPE